MGYQNMNESDVTDVSNILVETGKLPHSPLVNQDSDKIQVAVEVHEEKKEASERERTEYDRTELERAKPFFRAYSVSDSKYITVVSSVNEPRLQGSEVGLKKTGSSRDRPRPSVHSVNSSEVKVAVVNVQCLRTKINLLSLFTDELKCDFLLISEHWLTNDESEFYRTVGCDELEIANIYCRSAHKNGGVAIFASNRFTYKKLNSEPYCVERIFEVTAVEVLEISTILVAVYRPPDSDFDLFQLQLESCLLYLTKFTSKKIVIGGDFNIHLEVTSKEETAFTNLLRSFGLYITSRLPTRGVACLDTIATNIDSWDCRSEVVSALVADHDGAVVLNVKTEQTTPPSSQEVGAWWSYALRLNTYWRKQGPGSYQTSLR
ncbi:uncharacterized protein LOC128989384 [Macrosteles quadrilineatus]|uniref:uncharacterized protein LOC128989384 n=1 Tax=Macrosteles quadrilineatus TaxID=74068 RepID=UPI0023E115CA|nr:uncharacterized protein LOC128989384 [Macrosteles quadrilineatus]